MRLDKNSSLKIYSVGKAVKKCTLILCWYKHKIVQFIQREKQQYPTKIFTCLFFYPRVPFLGIYLKICPPKEFKNTHAIRLFVTQNFGKHNMSKYR